MMFVVQKRKFVCCFFLFLCCCFFCFLLLFGFVFVLFIFVFVCSFLSCLVGLSFNIFKHYFLVFLPFLFILF